MKSAKSKAVAKKLHGDEGIREALSNTRKVLGHKPFDKKAWDKKFMGKGRSLPDVPDVFSDMHSGKKKQYENEND